MSYPAIIAIGVVGACVGLCVLSILFKAAKWLAKGAIFLAILAAIVFLLLHLQG